MEQNFATRLKFFMDQNGFSSSFFADECGIPRPSFSQILSGRNKKINDNVIRMIHERFPDLSIIWLMFGEGEMMTTSEAERENSSKSDGDSPEIIEDSPRSEKYSSLKGLTSDENELNRLKNQIVNANSEIQDLQSQIENLRKNPRKVTQITIYYDDSTFETFYPNK